MNEIIYKRREWMIVIYSMYIFSLFSFSIRVIELVIIFVYLAKAPGLLLSLGHLHL